MKNLYLLQYSNYYNRVIKKKDTLEEYLNAAANYEVCSGRNYNPYDGISTKFTINTQDLNSDFPYDYLLVCDETDNIVARWYIMEAVRQCQGQFVISCYRDVITDWYDDVVNSTTFIEKAYVGVGDSAIYNSEDMTFNQIKTRVTALRDETNSQWIVGYIPKDLEKNTFSFDVINSYTSIKSYNSLASWPYYSMIDKEYQTSLSGIDVWAMYDMGYYALDFALGITINSQSVQLADMSKNRFFEDTDRIGSGYAVGEKPTFTPTATAENVDGRYEKLANILYDKCNHSTLWPLAKEDSTTNVPVIESQVGKVFKDLSTGAVYKVVKTTSIKEEYEPINAGNFYNELVKCFSLTYSYGFSGNKTVNQNGPFRCRKDYTAVVYSLQQITEEASVNISDRMHLTDSPYDMFVLPYKIGGYKYTIDDVEYTMSREFVMQIATTIGAEMGSQAVYDVQLLPYCPIRYMLDDDGNITNPATRVSPVKNTASNATIGHIFWGIQSWDEFRIPFEIECSTDPVEFKVQNQCDLYRLVGPNDGSAFDFSITKNQGVSAFLVSFTYKPFQPYIHIYPHFRGLYGGVYSNDKRGLILRGDFSLPQTSNAWANYKLNNSNYENIFNRQIESLELQNKYQKQSDIINAATGALSAGITGGMGGAMMLGPAGMAVGGATGVISAAAGAYDVQINDKLRQDNLDLTKDQFGYQLANIQAIPNTLTKVSAFDIDCSDAPLLEYYTCTEIEKQALRDKIAYNGMTVMRIGQITNFIQPDRTYIKGKIVRFPNSFTEDTHVANIISKEINTGVYI